MSASSCRETVECCAADMRSTNLAALAPCSPTFTKPSSVPRELNDGELRGSPADPNCPFVLSARQCDGSPEPAIEPIHHDSSFNSRRPTLTEASQTEFYSVCTLDRRVSNPRCGYIDAGVVPEHRGHRNSARWNCSWFDRNHSAIERQQHAPIGRRLVLTLP